jgi:hypothetical protein
MTDGIHFQVDSETGHLRLLCNAAEFTRLSTWLREEAKVTSFITIPATEIRIVSVELATEDETPPSTGKQLASFGCAIALMTLIVSCLVGLVTMARWVVE